MPNSQIEQLEASLEIAPSATCETLASALAASASPYIVAETHMANALTADMA